MESIIAELFYGNITPSERSYRRTGEYAHILQLVTRNEEELTEMLTEAQKREELIRILLSANEISMDTETTSTEAIDAKLVGLSFSIHEGQAWYVPCNTQEIVEEFRPIYENEKTLKMENELLRDFLSLTERK